MSHPNKNLVKVKKVRSDGKESFYWVNPNKADKGEYQSVQEKSQNPASDIPVGFSKKAEKAEKAEVVSDNVNDLFDELRNDIPELQDVKALSNEEGEIIIEGMDSPLLISFHDEPNDSGERMVVFKDEHDDRMTIVPEGDIEEYISSLSSHAKSSRAPEGHSGEYGMDEYFRRKAWKQHRRRASAQSSYESLDPISRKVVDIIFGLFP